MESENIELKDLNPRDGEAEEDQQEEDEEDTSFWERYQRLFPVKEDDSFLERHQRLFPGGEVSGINEKDNLFAQTRNGFKSRPSTSEWDPDAIPSPFDLGVVRRDITYDKKQFINKVFRMKVNKGAGPYSKLLYDGLRITNGEKSGKINGAEYKGKKILFLQKGGKMVYSKNKANTQLILEFKNLLNKAIAEHNATPASIVEDHIDHEISEETADNIRMKAANDMEQKLDSLRDQAENNTNITKQELRVLAGVLKPDWDDLIESKDPIHKRKVTDNLKALDIQKQDYKEKSLEAKAAEDPGREALYDIMSDAVELKADEVRTKINLKAKGDLAIEILKEEADKNEMVKFDKFKKWAKENLLGLSAIAITVAGILVTIFSAARTVIKGGADALGKFGRAVANIAKKFGPIIGAVGSIIASVLSAAGAGLKWLAQNIWLLAVALTYFIYNEYKKRGLR